MTSVTASPERRIRVPLSSLGLAPENLRAAEPADDGVPRLAETIRAAGVIYPPIVRRGRKGEAPFMVLDGRRRRFALLRLVESGDLAPDSEVDCVLAADKAAQAAATVVTNTEHAPVHLADVVVAIGKLRRSRMPTAAIAAALGYDELEIKRLEVLARVEPTVLQAYRQGRLTLTQVRLFARLKDRRRQAELAQSALDGYFHEHQLQSLVQAGRVTVEDVRFPFVSAARYAQAGGRLDSDLFGELPDVVLDRELLSALWRARAEAVGAGLAAAGLTVLVGEERSYRAPDGLSSMPYVHIGSLPEAARATFDAAADRAEAVLERIEAAGPAGATDPDVGALLDAQLDAARATLAGGAIEAVLLTPRRGAGVEPTFFWRPPEIAPSPGDAVEDDDGQADEEDDGMPASGVRRYGDPPDVAVPQVAVDVQGIGHGLHEVRTDLATRGLIRALADHPEAAVITLVAELFKQLALHGGCARGESALALSASAYSWPGRPAVAALDGHVRGRLAARRDAYLASGQRPIAWVAGLAPDDRLALLAELTAIALDLREPRTTSLWRPARAEAAEIAALCGADLAVHWTPDDVYLAAHAKPQLLQMLRDMDAPRGVAPTLRKDDLVGHVAAQAAARGWTPQAVRWTAPVEAAVDDAARDAEAGETDEGQNEVATPVAA
jgi:ParB family chromosome partitioning protein